jgi:hypothetical protein
MWHSAIDSWMLLAEAMAEEAKMLKPDKLQRTNTGADRWTTGSKHLENQLSVSKIH